MNGYAVTVQCSLLIRLFVTFSVRCMYWLYPLLALVNCKIFGNKANIFVSICTKPNKISFHFWCKHKFLKYCLKTAKCMFEDFNIHSTITSSIFPRKDESKIDKGKHHEPPGVGSCLRNAIKALWESVLYIHQQGLNSISLCILLRACKGNLPQTWESSYISEDPIHNV